MSSHREAPGISRDPVADNTDVYAFRSPEQPDTVTLIANYIPVEDPAGGPNFHSFGDDVLYAIHVDNDGDGAEEISFEFRFATTLQNPNTFLYNTGPIAALDDPNWNMRQTYSVTRVEHKNKPKPAGKGKGTLLGSGLATPPVNIGPRSTPAYESLAASAVHSLPDDTAVFAGPREDPFFVDLGSIFDLAALRPLQSAHLIPLPNAAGRDGLKGSNVHAIAVQVPISALTRDGSQPTDVLAPEATIGVWATASRQKTQIRHGRGRTDAVGPYVQVSRLGNPLINEVVIPLGRKDEWNERHPSDDADFVPYYKRPELAGLLPVLYPGVFPNLDSLVTSGAERKEIAAILLTGIEPGIISGFQNFTGPRQADMLRLNMGVPPASSPHPLGLLGGDTAGFPNGRRLSDDIVAIELRALAGALYPLVDPGFTPDSAVSLLADGTANDGSFLSTFPYLGTPHQGFDHSHD